MQILSTVGQLVIACSEAVDLSAAIRRRNLPRIWRGKMPTAGRDYTGLWVLLYRTETCRRKVECQSSRTATKHWSCRLL